MLSTKLVQLIERNWEEIAARLIQAVRKHPDMQHLAQRPDSELRDWCRELVADLGYRLSTSKDEEVKRRFQILGRMRFEEDVPLHEAVLRLHVLKDTIIAFLHERGFPMTALDLYGKEELELRMGRFFDAMTYHIVRGYEDAQRVAARVA
jgi:hypothetical protein